MVPECGRCWYLRNTFRIVGIDGRSSVSQITWEGNVGETQGDDLYVDTFDDVDPAFVYDVSWLNNPPELGSFSGGTGQYVFPLLLAFDGLSKIGSV